MPQFLYFGIQGVFDSEGPALTMLGFLVNRVNKVPHLQKEFLVPQLNNKLLY